jgi:HTH-type transcriptional regulator / antitoxin HipB
LRRRRKALRLSQQELADLAGVSKPSVVAAEQGKTTLRLSVLEGIAGALGFRLALADLRGPE